MKIKDFVLKNKVKISITIFLCVIASILLYIFFIIYLPGFVQKHSFENSVLSFANKNQKKEQRKKTYGR